MISTRDKQQFCGREFTREELSLIQEVVETCAGISRTELSHTVCELRVASQKDERLMMVMISFFRTSRVLFIVHAPCLAKISFNFRRLP